jgi:hypothetical protein
MTTRRPTLLRWSEEAEQVRALKGLEHAPHSAAARPVAFALHPFSTRHRSAVLPWLLSWFAAADPQIERDGGPTDDLS